jgi:hypothetical protein
MLQKPFAAPDSLVQKIAQGNLASAQIFKSTMLDLATARMKQALEGRWKVYQH